MVNSNKGPYLISMAFASAGGVAAKRLPGRTTIYGANEARG